MWKHLFNPTFIFECLAFLAANLFLTKRTGAWRLFIPMLNATLLVETVGWKIAYLMGRPNNNWIYNLLLIFSSLFNLYILAGCPDLQPKRKHLRTGIILFAVFSITNLIGFEGFVKYNVYTEIVADILTFSYCCQFFLSVVAQEKYIDLSGYEYFWLSVGFLFSSLGGVMMYIFLDSLVVFFKKTGVNVYGYINYGVNLVLYGSQVIAFICRNKNTRLSRASSFSR